MVNRYQDNLQGVCQYVQQLQVLGAIPRSLTWMGLRALVFSPKFTRYLVVREDEHTGELHQVTCSEHWTFNESDAERVREILCVGLSGYTSRRGD